MNLLNDTPKSMAQALACREIKKKALELYTQQGLSVREILVRVENKTSQETVYRWIREWKAEQQQNAQTSKEVA
jgi:transposase